MWKKDVEALGAGRTFLPGDGSRKASYDAISVGPEQSGDDDPKTENLGDILKYESTGLLYLEQKQEKDEQGQLSVLVTILLP